MVSLTLTSRKDRASPNVVPCLMGCFRKVVFTLVTRGCLYVFDVSVKNHQTQWWNFRRQLKERPRVTQCETPTQRL